MTKVDIAAYRNSKHAGVDEAGRGALAGPVVAASVVLPETYSIDGLGDSKLISESNREMIYAIIISQAVAWGIAIVPRSIVDRINVFQATMMAMQKSVARLGVVPDEILVDGNKLPDFGGVPARAIVKGDQKEPCISAASIVAKVVRDRVMARYALRYPNYGFDRHKGYGTSGHYDAILEHGPCPIHRRSFKLFKEQALFVT